MSFPHFLIESVLVVAAFLAGVYFAPDIRADVVKIDDYIRGAVAKDKAAVKSSIEKKVEKL